MDSELSPSDAGLTSQPESETDARHAGASTAGVGEVSREPLANLGELAYPTPSFPPGETPGLSEGGSSESTSDDTEMVIVRATSKIRVDLADIATDREAHIRRQCGKKEGGCLACLAAARLYESRNLVAALFNVAVRLYWRIDSALIDRYRLTRGRPPKGPEWGDVEVELESEVRALLRGSELPEAAREELVKAAVARTKSGKPYLYAYPVLRAMAPQLQAGLVSNICRVAEQKWRSCRVDALLTQKCSPPHYTSTQPIPLREADYWLKRHGEHFKVGFSIRADHDGKGKEFTLVLRAHDAYERTLLGELADGVTAKKASASIAEDRLRPGRWFLTFAYKRKVKRKVGVRAAAINKGLVCFLASVTCDGKQWIYDGDDIEAYLRQIKRRRVQYQHQLKVSRRGGHGRDRVLQPIERLTGKAERWRKTRCQVIARRFVDWLVTNDIARLYVDDFTGIRDALPEKIEGGKWVWQRIQEWPDYQLQMRIASCCEEEGIDVVVRNPARITTTCPRCDHCSPDNISLKTRRFLCKECQFSRNMDVVAAKNNLRFGEAERLKEEAEKAAKAVKDVVSTEGVEGDGRRYEGVEGTTAPAAKKAARKSKARKK